MLPASQHNEQTREVLQILGAWGTTASQQVILLGLPTGMLAHYQKGAALPEEDDIVTRVKTLLAIDHSVCLAFPHTPDLARLWVSTANHFLDGNTPLAVMLTEGLSGIIRIQSLLNGENDW